jgi:hypothetical protein
MTEAFYDTDFYRWTQTQAAALRALEAKAFMGRTIAVQVFHGIPQVHPVRF